MSVLLSRASGLVPVFLLAGFAGFAGLIVGHVLRLPGQPTFTQVTEYPLPHHVPKYEGGITLRFAMVHDVIHERYPRHGLAYYRERNRLVRKQLADGQRKDSDAYLALFDDLGAGLDALGDDDEAVRVLRDKLRRQEKLGQKEGQLYTTYANLGTFLIHGNARAARSGDSEAQRRLREGLELIKKAIEVNPQAHFGREVWQAVAVEYLLAVSKDPRLLLKYDLIGDRLDEKIDPAVQRSFTHLYTATGAGREVKALLWDGGRPWYPETPKDLRDRYITRVGAGAGWEKAGPCSLKEPAPFDEPALGIVGMWRLGGGANPYFALALGEIMLRVGQRYIAWCAYERAAGMADRVWPDPAIQQSWREHCQHRQQLLEGQLPAEEVKELRPRFEAELAHGQGYQKAYQEYEARAIQAGKSIDDEHFHDAFEAAHEPIASPVGEEEKLVAANEVHRPFFNWPIAMLAAGVGACVGACIFRLLHACFRPRQGPQRVIASLGPVEGRSQ